MRQLYSKMWHIYSKKIQKFINIFSQYMYEIIDDLSQSKGTINKVGLACLVYVRIYMIKAETTMRQAPRFSLALNFCLKLRLWVGYSTIFSWGFFQGYIEKKENNWKTKAEKFQPLKNYFEDYTAAVESSAWRKLMPSKLFSFGSPLLLVLTLFHFGKAESCIILWTW